MPKKRLKEDQEEVKNRSGLLGKLNITESYTSLLLGIIVVVILSFLVVAFIKGQKPAEDQSTKDESSINTIDKQAEKEKTSLGESQSGSTYTVKEGDSLWGISEKAYKSGYNWVDIARANNLQVPSLIHAGNKLTLPKIDPKIATKIQKTPMSEPNSDNAEAMMLLPSEGISGSLYTVVKNDDLWTIAVRAYGDGYKWVDIAKLNNLVNPDIIEVGQVLKLPRS